MGRAVPDPPCSNFTVELHQHGLVQVGFICGFRSHTIVPLLLRWSQPGPLGAPSGWPSCLYPALHTSWHPGCPRLRLHFPCPSSEVSPLLQGAQAPLIQMPRPGHWLCPDPGHTCRPTHAPAHIRGISVSVYLCTLTNRNMGSCLVPRPSSAHRTRYSFSLFTEPSVWTVGSLALTVLTRLSSPSVPVKSPQSCSHTERHRVPQRLSTFCLSQACGVLSEGCFPLT